MPINIIKHLVNQETKRNLCDTNSIPIHINKLLDYYTPYRSTKENKNAPEQNLFQQSWKENTVLSLKNTHEALI